MDTAVEFARWVRLTGWRTVTRRSQYGQSREYRKLRTQKRRVGILGGFSHVSTGEYYLRFHNKYYERCKDFHYPETVVFSLDFQKFTDLENSKDRHGYIEYASSGIDALARCAVDFVVLAANSPHAILSELQSLAPVPILSIVDVTLAEARRRHYETLLLLGIKFTMQSDFYAAGGRQVGIHVVSPSLEDQDEIERIVFRELSIGHISNESRARLIGMVAGYDVDGVILGCTELPLILKPGDTTAAVLDTLDLHTECALAWAIGRDAAVPWPGSRVAAAVARRRR